MGTGASAGVSAGIGAAKQDDLVKLVGALDGPTQDKLRQALTATQAAAPDGRKTNSAYLFIKPHAVTDAVKALVGARLREVGMTVNSEGEIKAEDIDAKQFIDVHYGAIAGRAMTKDPKDNVVTEAAQEKFKTTFGADWKETLEAGSVFNASQAAKKLEIDYDALGVKWEAMAKDQLVKFGGGFYCGKIDGIFVINGFYMGMRKKFTTPGTSIYYFSVDWPEDSLSWADFRGKVLGATNPAEAAEGSLRASIKKDWEAMGLKGEPNTGDNGVHGSASPFEGLCERVNWLGAAWSEDKYAKAMIQGGVSEETLKAWSSDPAVEFEGVERSIFDRLEDINASECIDLASKIAGGK